MRAIRAWRPANQRAFSPSSPRRPSLTTARVAFRPNEGQGLPPSPSRMGSRQPSNPGIAALPHLPDLISDRMSHPATPEAAELRPSPAREPNLPGLDSKSGTKSTLHHHAPQPLPALSRPALRHDSSERAA